MKRFIKISGNIMFYMFFTLLLTIIFVTARAKAINKVPTLFGYKAFTVLTGSMSPTIEVGSLIIVKESEAYDIHENDIITYRNETVNSVTTHRVIEVNHDNGVKFITKGDANNSQDRKEIDFDLLEGKVVGIVPNVGTGARFIQQYIVYILFLIVFISVVFSLLKGKKMQKRLS